MKRNILFVAIVASAFLFAQILFPFGSQASDTTVEPIVDTQTRAVATNLGLFGGQSSDFAVDPTSDNLYIITMAPNGFFISNDKGETFHGLSSELNLGTGKQVEVDPADGNVYVSIGDTLLKSTDKGEDFHDITKNLGDGNNLGEALLFGHSRLLAARNSGAGSSANLVVSTDGGKTFSRSTAGSGTIQSLAASPATDTFFAAVSSNSSEKLYKSTDGGSNWTEVSIPSGQRISVVAVDPYDVNHIVITNTRGDTSNSIQSADGGVTWSSDLKSEGQNVAANYVAFDGERMYIGHFYTTDRGTTWGRITTETPLSSIYADKFAFDPNNRNILFTNTVYGLAKSTDRGVTWEDKVSGVASVKVYDITQANNKGVVYIAANGGLAKTTNFTSGLPDWVYPLSGTGSASAYAVWVKPNDPNTVLYGDHNWIKKSTDGGTTWTVVTTMGSGNPGAGDIKDIVSHPENNNILYAALSNSDLARADSGYVFKSTDGGDTWKDLNIPGDVPAISLSVDKDGNLYVGTGGDSSTGIYRYSDGSWAKLSGGPAKLRITSVLVDPTNSNLLMAATNDDGGFFRSTDAGETWAKPETLSEVNNMTAIAVQTSTSPNTFYAAGQDQSKTSDSLNGVIYKSSDGGATWGKYYVGLKQEGFYALLFDGLAAGNDRGLYGIKGKAKVKVAPHEKTIKKGQIVTFRITLKDAATKKKLKNRKVALFKKVGKKWKRVKQAKTDKNAQASIQVAIKKKTTFQVRFKPKRKSDKAEYALSKSKKIKIKIIS